MLVVHCAGGGEVAQFVDRHRTGRVPEAVLVSPEFPAMVKTETNPDGVASSVFHGFRDAMQKDRAQIFIDVRSRPFFGFNRHGAQVSQG